jgi:large subunit ribosomal protein L25
MGSPGFLVSARPQGYKPAVRGSDTPGGTLRAFQQRKTRRISTMATVNDLKATARPRAGKGAARAVRREGRVPGVIYGDNQPPLAISLDFDELKHRIHSGRFLTSICNVEVDGKTHRTIPRDFQVDPVRDNPIHVDFLRLGEGATIRVRIPVHVKNAEESPGVKRGGAVNIVTHTVEVMCPADSIPEAFDVDVSGLEINYSRHLSDIQLPPNVRPVAHGDVTLVTIVPPSGYAEELKAAADAAAAAAAAAATAATAAASAPTGAPGAAPGAAGGAPAAGAGAADKK